MSAAIYTYTLIKQPSSGIVAIPWWEGLHLVIKKDGKTVELEGEEIKDLVDKLPRTFGGTY